ncbi:MAG: 50S ribosomal protein L19e [Nanoarchaeota archaeon]|nr:50S ribosomal protein L19e [Nanoarchaeota archaeon]
MNLRSKKDLIARTAKVGKDRIKFTKTRMDEIKEAITKQEFKELIQSGAIVVKPIQGRRTNIKRRNKKGAGIIKKKVNKRKQEYVIMTRKLRRYSKEMESQGVIKKDEHKEIRKRIRNRAFKSKANLKLYIEGLKK